MILAIETATAACSVAVADDEARLLAAVCASAGPAHTIRLLADIHHALGMARAAAADLRTVVVGLGPGTFTGLRIGVATARALAQALGARLVGVPTLASLAMALAEGDAAAGSSAFVPLLDGKRGEVFAACYCRPAGQPSRKRAGRSASRDRAGHPDAPVLELVRGPVAVPAAQLRAFLAPWPHAIVGGDGAHLYAADLPADAHLATCLCSPTAVMALRAWEAAAAGVVQGADEVLPLYGRAPDAVRWTARPPVRSPAKEVEAP